jgi:hypothetical protein
MYERTRFGTTPHSQKVVQDSDAYKRATEGKIKAPTAVELVVAARVGVLQHRTKLPAGASSKIPKISACRETPVFVNSR